MRHGRRHLGRHLASAALLAAGLYGAAASAQVPPPGSPEPRIAQAPAPASAPSPAGGLPAAPAAAPAEPAAKGGGTGRGPELPRPILPPADPVAAAAFAILDKHCSRCHQGGRLTRAAPAAALGNILRLDEIAGAPHLVAPGNPDGSRLYLMMLRRLMPLDLHTEKAAQPLPAPDEIAAIRAWIAGLSPRPVCRDRRIVSAEDHVTALRRIAAAPGASPARTRFVSIAHLHNGCVSFEALEAYRQAISRIVNSLSWKASPVAIAPIDAARTLYAIDLDELGWQPEHWERIMRLGADPIGLMPPLPAEIRSSFATPMPLARADWLAETVLLSPLYYEVLGLPGSGPEIQKILQLDAEAARLPQGVLRGGAKPSGFAMSPSLVERFPARPGAVWQALNRQAQATGADLATYAARPASEAAPYDVGRVMFTLPNGLPAFYVVDPRGNRLDAVPGDVALSASRHRGEVKAGLDCLACHAGGPLSGAGPLAPRELVDAATRDREAVAAALRRIGLEPGLALDGVEPVVALAREYSRPLDGVRVAAELGVGIEQIADIADRGEQIPAVLARRLLQGVVSRAEIEARGRDLILALGRPLPEARDDGFRPSGGPESDAKPSDPGPGLVLYSDKLRYKRGDPLHLTIKVSQDCHLTVVSIDQRGRGTVIFPSDFETNGLLTAGQELKLPGPGAPYSFRLNETGRETIVALCNETAAPTDGIRHDFERQRFTDLGNYAAHLAASATGASARPQAEAKAAEPRQRGRRRAAKPEPPEQPARPDQISRTAITITVE